ncbi:MAG: nitroreductase [Victivallales bacterium]|nr:nitroreductase [Victivallales bacterium]
MNAVLEAIKARRSVRAFRPELVPEELLTQVLEAGTYAATGMNWQSPTILAVTNREVRDELMRLNAEVIGNPGSDPFYGAPVVLTVLADPSRPTYIYDGSLVMGNLMLAAHALGLGSCWIHRAKETFECPEGKAILARYGLPENLVGIGNCALGYPAAPPRPVAPRKPDYIKYIR